MFLVIHTHLSYDGQRTEKKTAIYRSYSSKADIAANFNNKQTDGHTVLDPRQLSTHKPEMQGGEVIAMHNGKKGTTIIEVLHIDRVSEM